MGPHVWGWQLDFLGVLEYCPGAELAECCGCFIILSTQKVWLGMAGIVIVFTIVVFVFGIFATLSSVDCLVNRCHFGEV